MKRTTNHYTRLSFSITTIVITCFIIVAGIAGNSSSDNGKIDHYKNRYGVKCVSEKITDNFGNGFDALYGTRNMRTILFGVAYRGGANNFYHKTNKRDNHNPLPADGLQHLADEGFSGAVYLYSTNFKSAGKYIFNNKTGDTLRYIQNSGNERKRLRELMLMVLEVINNPDKGPIYFHCWNGWHQSGYVSASILMQFCNYSNEKAYKYWIKNTDGVTKGYDKVKKKIKTFKTFPDISISDSVRKKICPCME